MSKYNVDDITTTEYNEFFRVLEVLPYNKYRGLLCLLGFHKFETVWTFQNDFWFDWHTGRAKSTIRCKYCGKEKTR